MNGARRGGARSGGPPARALALLVLAAFALAARGGDGGSTTASAPADAGLRVEVTPPRAGPSDVVRARVVNDSSETFTYGLAYVLEMQEGGSFVKVSEPRVVPQIGLVAKPGETGPPV